MRTTAELLTKALDLKKAAAWCRELNLTEGALSHAKKKGRLSPSVAGFLAIEIGEDPILWAAIAATEAEPPGPLKERLAGLLERQVRTVYGPFFRGFLVGILDEIEGFLLALRDT